ncbi:MAG: hypothetical protein J6V20_07740 [Bacteroidaceae bacterium]|nr:hypothetical protein [Bacteroidaceae bacterium]
MYDFYMLTGEGAEYFEDITEEDYCQEECQEELYFETFNDWLDYNIERLEAEIAEKKRIIAE